MGMRNTKKILICLMTVLLLGFFAQPAMAQYEGTGDLSGSASSGAAGSSLTITGGGFEPGETVNIYFTSERQLIGTTTADENGNISAVITIPSDATAGVHTISAVGQSSGRTLTMSFTVTAGGTSAGVTTADAGQGLGLAFTGATLLFWILSGLALVGLGIGVIKGRSPEDDTSGPNQ